MLEALNFPTSRTFATRSTTSYEKADTTPPKNHSQKYQRDDLAPPMDRNGCRWALKTQFVEQAAAKNAATELTCKTPEDAQTRLMRRRRKHER